MGKSRYAAKQVVDIGGGVPALTSYWLLAAATGATLTGFYVDESGTRMQNLGIVSLTIPIGDGSNSPVNLQGATPPPPEAAVGFIGQLTGPCFVDRWSGDGFSPAFQTLYAQFPLLTAGGFVALGRVSQEVFATQASSSILPVLRPPISVTPVCDTSIMAANDLICDVTRVPNASWAIDQPAFLEGVTLFDQDDNIAIQMKLFICNNNTSLGSLNSAPNISDANGLEVMKIVDIPAADWYDMGGFKAVNVSPALLPRQVWPKAGTRDIYFALAVGSAGTPTYTASGIKTVWEFQDAVRGA